MNLASGETKNETRAATSSGFPTCFKVDAFLNYVQSFRISQRRKGNSFNYRSGF